MSTRNQKTSKQQPARKKTSSVRTLGLIASVLIALLGIVWYANTTQFPFYFDDDTSIVSNEAIKGNAVVSAIWESDPRRIIPYLTFAANYAAHGLDVEGYHMVNIAIHIATGCAVFWFVWLLTGAPAMRGNLLAERGRGILTDTRFLFALFVALMFVSHPVQTQAVTYIVQRMASLAALFSVLALGCYAVFAQKRAENKTGGTLPYALALMFTVCAMLTKENTFVLPLILLLLDYMFYSLTGAERKKALTRFIPFALTLLIIPLLTFQWGNSGTVGYTENAEIGSKIPALHYLFTQFNVIVTYIRLLFLPIHQNLDYHYPVATTLFGVSTLFSLLFLLALLGFAGWLWNRQRLASFGIFFFFLSLAVESSILSLPDVIFEHRLYLPIVGFLLAAGTGLFWLVSRLSRSSVPSPLLPVALAGFVLAAGIATYQRNEVWSNVESLWGDVIQKSPGKARPYNNLGDFYYKTRQFDKALPLFEKAVQIEPNSAAACNNLGCLLWYKGQLDEAEMYVRRAITSKRRFYQAYNILGSIYFNRGQIDSAEYFFRQSLEDKPDFVDAMVNLGAVYMQHRELDRAVTEYRKVLTDVPNHPQANYNLALIYFDQQKYALAVQHADKAKALGLALAPSFAERLQPYR